MALNGIQQNKLDKLRAIIRKEILSCNSGATPNICQMTKTKKGYLQVEEVIIKRCLQNLSTPNTEIGLYESELAD